MQSFLPLCTGQRKGKRAGGQSATFHCNMDTNLADTGAGAGPPRDTSICEFTSCSWLPPSVFKSVSMLDWAKMQCIYLV